MQHIQKYMVGCYTTHGGKKDSLRLPPLWTETSVDCMAGMPRAYCTKNVNVHNHQVQLYEWTLPLSRSQALAAASARWRILAKYPLGFTKTLLFLCQGKSTALYPGDERNVNVCESKDTGENQRCCFHIVSTLNLVKLPKHISHTAFIWSLVTSAIVVACSPY